MFGRLEIPKFTYKTHSSLNILTPGSGRRKYGKAEKMKKGKKQKGDRITENWRLEYEECLGDKCFLNS